MGSLFELAAAQIVDYSRNQPKKLFDMAMNAVGDLAETAATNLSFKIKEEDWIEDIKEFIKEEIFPINNYLYNDLPMTCIKELQDTIHDRMVKFYVEEREDHEILVNHEPGITGVPTEIMTYMCFHPCMTELNVLRFPTVINREIGPNQERCRIGYLIRENLDKMFYLRSFSFSGHSSVWLAPPSLLINYLVNFEHLEVFEYSQATDELIRELVDCCPKLRVVNVNNSNITDLGAGYLHQLKYLQCLYMENTRVTLDECTRLMLKLQIAKFSFSQPLNTIIMNLKKDQKNTHMKSANFSNFLATDQLNKAVLSFPNLTRLSLNYEQEPTLPPEDQLVLQKYLLSLDLLVLQNGTGLVNAEVHVLKTVTRFHLLNVNSIDVEQIKMINDLFPSLKELVIYQSEVGTHNHDAFSPLDVLFPNLEKFYCQNIVSKNLVSSVLSNCKNIKEITIDDPRSRLFDDSWFECLLMYNPMYDLEIFQTTMNTLTIDSVYLMFKRCRKLRELCIRFNSLQQLAHFQLFKRAIKRGNFKLKLDHNIPSYQFPM